MDPLTHALLGATAAQAALGPRLGRQAWLSVPSAVSCPTSTS
jgi:hypothetical protein